MNNFQRVSLIAAVLLLFVALTTGCNLDDPGVEMNDDSDANVDDNQDADDNDEPLQCDVGETICEADGNAICVDTTSDVEHCGGCNAACTNDVDGAESVCEEGSCEVVCSEEGHEVCDGVCIDVDSDPDNCGSCGSICPTGNCAAGSCDLPDCDAGDVPFGGGNGSVETPYTICTPEHLHNIREASDDGLHLALTTDLDVTGMYFVPIEQFDGTLNGYGMEITGLTIEEPSQDVVGLFGELGPSATVEDLYLSSVYVEGDDAVGGLAGVNEGGTISGVTVDGELIARDYAGGLVGAMFSGTIEDSQTTMTLVSDGSSAGGLVGSLENTSTISGAEAHGSVRAEADDVGGLVGRMEDEATVTDCHVHGQVEGYEQNVGGLVGIAIDDSLITDSSATGDVWSGVQFAGGLVGQLDFGATVERSFASADVEATENYAGGLVGAMRGNLTDCYAAGNVTADSDVGGLVGAAASSSIVNTYAFGAVDASNDVGGLVGEGSPGDVSASYWNIETVGEDISAGGVGLESGEFGDQSLFEDAGWDFDEVWTIGSDGDWERPKLQWELD